MAAVCHNGLVKLNKKLDADLEEVLQQELLWYQRPRENWIHSGDRNTKFYHLSTKVRHNQKKGFIFEDTTSQEAENFEESGNFLHNYFTYIFSCQETDEYMQSLG